MCFNTSVPQDNSAALARQQADERQAAITQGKTSIDNAFSVFDPAYYDKYTQANEDYYNPQVDKQFTDARQKMKYNLSRAGIQDASEGQRQFGELTNTYDDARRQIASNAEAATNQLKQTVDSQKNDLYAQNSASADPSLSSISALSSAGSLQSPATYSPLGNVFSGLVNAGTYYLNGTQKGLPSGYASAFAPGASLPSSGSGSVVK